MRIYTKRGDKGSTSLLAGATVAKSHPLVEANGAIDEAQSALGVVRALVAGDEALASLVAGIQRKLYEVMAEVASAHQAGSSRRGARPRVAGVGEEDVRALEERIDEYMAAMALPREFVLPGESLEGALADLARAIVRRAERRVVAAGGALSEGFVVPYLNRLSDFLWVLARWLDGSVTTARGSGTMAGASKRRGGKAGPGGGHAQAGPVPAVPPGND
jgi:cob(I)alamin adenosyltransferase